MADVKLIDPIEKASRAPRRRDYQVSLERNLNPDYFDHSVPKELVNLVFHIAKHGKDLKKRYQHLINFGRD